MADINVTELVTTTLTNQKRKLVDNVKNNVPLWWYLEKRGNVRLGGGRKIRESIIHATNGTIQYQGAYDTFNTTPQKEFDAADFDWKIITGTVSLDKLTIAQNKGREQIFNLISNKVRNLKTSLANQLGTTVYSDGTTANEPGGLRLLIADDPTTGTVGGISRATNSFWRNKLYDFSTESVTPGSDTMQGSLDVLFRRCLVQGTEMPDLFMADNTYFGYYQAGLQSIQRIGSPMAGEGGFRALKYQGGDFVYDPQCPSAHVYMINTNHLFLKHLNPSVFNVEKARSPYNQDTTVIPVKGYLQFTADNMRGHGVMIA